MGDRTKAIFQEAGITLAEHLNHFVVDVARWISIGQQVERECEVYGNSVWQRIDGVIVSVDPTTVRFKVEIPEEEPYRELTDSEERAEEATWD